jgi:hypothetical protein
MCFAFSFFSSQAANELAQLLSEDPTELNKALLTAEAALRRVKRKFGEGTKDPKEAGKEEGGKGSDCASGLAGLKTNGCTAGTIWWLEREMTEAKKYKFSGEITVKFVGGK